ncbi:MAG: hypothetical protein IJF80_02175 [Clostridia bacterium]|nr:hypothetical protein [Clostridia bacterium]
MQIWTIGALSMLILACFGMLDKTSLRLGTSLFKISFAFVVYLALSAFSISLVTELRVSLAVLFMPLYFAYLSFSNKERITKSGFGAFVILSLIAAISLRSKAECAYALMGICIMLLGLIFSKSPIFSLAVASAFPILTEAFMAILDYMSYSYASLDLALTSVQNMQIIGVVLQSMIMTVFAKRAEVIKA